MRTAMALELLGNTCKRIHHFWQVSLHYCTGVDTTKNPPSWILVAEVPTYGIVVQRVLSSPDMAWAGALAMGRELQAQASWVRWEEERSVVEESGRETTV